MKGKLYLGFLVILLLLPMACKGSEVTTTPAIAPPSSEELARLNFASPEIPRILCEQLKQMMDRGDDLVLVDARSVEYGYKLGHLPRAISIPYKPEPPYTEQWITTQIEGLPKDELIIFYCD
ncbi:MAG: hypothetical protein JSU58_06165 [Dehalococcoidales bacterium]|nr:MAG: hypothetical protein JSU58_06165 [Dehalococcoidales bacterium]